MEATRPRGCVVIPAHNEALVIARTIRTLMDEAEPGEFEVVVVCNGCTDDTAAEARAVSTRDVAVMEVGEASKARALTAGDASARAFPRLYLDADVELTTKGARSLTKALNTSPCVVATPAYRLDRCTRLARAYWTEWLRRNPAPRSGTGCFGLSQSARESFGAFPDVLGDDQFVATTFAPDPVEDAITEVRAARTFSAILRRRIRIERGNREVRVALHHGRYPQQPAREFLQTQKDRPNAIGFGVLVLVHASAIAWSRVKPRGRWTQDVSSRTNAGPPDG